MGKRSISKKEHIRSVAREKYEHIKEKAQDWYRRAEELKKKHDKLAKINEDLEKENEKLSEALKKSEGEVKRWKSYSDNLPDDELEAENKNHRKTIRSLKKELKEYQDKYGSKITTLERDIMLKDGQILQLEEARKDLKERYNELKTDYREHQRWGRGVGIGNNVKENN